MGREARAGRPRRRRRSRPPGAPPSTLELAGGPGGPVAAVLRGEKREKARHDRSIHTFMIRGIDPPGLPFDPLDVPFSESRLPQGNPTAEVASSNASSTPRCHASTRAILLGKRFFSRHEAGLRMLAKYPGITLVGGIAMAFAIWFGTVTFEMFGLVVRTRSCRSRAATASSRSSTGTRRTSVPEKRSVHDFLTWREELRTVADLGAYRDVAAQPRGAERRDPRGAGRRDDGVGLHRVVGEASARAHARTERRARRRSAGRGPRLQGVEGPLRQRSRHPRQVGQDRRLLRIGRRRDGGGIRLPGRP